MVYMFLTNGFEETEAIVPLDILRRANISVTTVGIGGKIITGSHNIKIEADITEEEFTIDNLEAVILPGGPGHKTLKDNPTVDSALKNAYENGKLCAAICASPTILAAKGYLNGAKATCFNTPELRCELEKNAIPEYSKDVVTYKNIITSRAAGTALEFGFSIVEYLKGKETAENIRKSFCSL